MNLVLTLLITAMQLKVALLGLPVQYQSTVDKMMPTVDNAIVYAQTMIKNGTIEATTTPVVTPVVVQNPIGSISPIVTPVATSSEPYASTTEEVRQYKITDLSNQILVLNAKYAKDVSDVVNNPGMTVEQSTQVKGVLKNTYTSDYNVLKSQLDLLKASN